MLKISQLREYLQQVKDDVPAIKKVEIAVVKDNVTKFMQDHEETDNTLLICLVPEHDLRGQQDAAQWENTMGFFFLEKTDYSQHDHDSFLDIFERTQQVAHDFVDKLLEDKENNTGLFCGFLAFFDEGSVSVRPIVAFNQCNGYYVELSLRNNA